MKRVVVTGQGSINALGQSAAETWAAIRKSFNPGASAVATRAAAPETKPSITTGMR